jgi:hypothetical protein
VIPDSLGENSVFGGLGLLAGIGIGLLDRKWSEHRTLLVRALASGAGLAWAVISGKPLVIEAAAMALIGYWPVRLEMWMGTGLW